MEFSVGYTEDPTAYDLRISTDSPWGDEAQTRGRVHGREAGYAVARR